MRATIKDGKAVEALVPLNVVAYLRAHHWEKFSDSAGRFSVWTNPAHPDAEVVVPVDRTARDYVQQTFNTLSELEAVEGRSQIEILRDLYCSGFDVIRFAVMAPSVGDGSVRIDAGVQLFQKARDILSAAACAAVQPKAVYNARRPAKAVEYLKKARLGQTEHGSFVLSLLSPVAPSLGGAEQAHLFQTPSFERSVVETLANSVGMATLAAEIAATATTPDIQPFLEVVDQGVSANLCEGIYGMFDSLEPDAIEVSVSWALNRPPPNNVQSRIRINSDYMPTMKLAAEVLRSTHQSEDYQVRGPVIKLARSDGERVGAVTIHAKIENAYRSVTVLLDEPYYTDAMNAHASYRPVELRGTLVRESRERSFKLIDAGPLRIISENDLFDDDAES